METAELLEIVGLLLGMVGALVLARGLFMTTGLFSTGATQASYDRVGLLAIAAGFLLQLIAKLV